jgi:hypothetical protein
MNNVSMVESVVVEVSGAGQPSPPSSSMRIGDGTVRIGGCVSAGALGGAACCVRQKWWKYTTRSWDFAAVFEYDEEEVKNSKACSFFYQSHDFHVYLIW